jgi:predicted NBD/HSP70 family sugar kinase
MSRHLLAVDIGGSKIAVMAREVGSERVVHEGKLKTPAEDGVGAILRLLDEQIDALPGGLTGVKALGVDVPLRELLRERYSRPVFVERDANCAALGEKWCGAATEMNDFVFLALGTGVGAGLFLDGRIYRGAHFAAGEAGDMTFPSDEPRKSDAPTVSDVVGKRAIKKKARRVTGRRMSAAQALVEAKKQPRLERVTREVVEYLGTSVIAISSLIDPEAIFFGGGTSNAGEALLKRVRERVESHRVVRSRLLLAGLGAESQLYGALWGAINVAREQRSRSRSPRPGRRARPQARAAARMVGKTSSSVAARRD